MPYSKQALYICSDDCGNPKGHNKAVEEIAMLLYIDESIYEADWLNLIEYV